MNARTEPLLGLRHDLSNEDYHAIDALGSSGIKKLAKSPAHYFGAALDPNRPPVKPTPAMIAGTLAHCALLEPASLAERYAETPEGHDGRTKEGKAWLANVPAGVTIVTDEQMRTARRQADAVRSLSEVAAVLATGRPEVSAFWIDEATGVHCKCRPDWVSPVGGGVILLDLKTCQDASPEGFPRTIANFGYHLQAAWYSDGYERASGQRVLGFVFACVEAAYPHAAAAYMLDDESLDKARAENRRLIEVYAECRRTARWPGYPDSIQLLTLPKWAA